MRKQLVLSLVSLALLGFHAQANAQSNTWQGYAYLASMTRRVRSVMWSAPA